jgi:hypothetical protein
MSYGLSLGVAVRLSVLALGGSLLCGAVAYAQAPAAPGAAPAAAAPAAPAAPVTPRNADGKPNLGGLWAGGVGLPSGVVDGSLAGRGGNWNGVEEDNALLRLTNNRRPAVNGVMPPPNFPQYRPEFWEVVKNNDYDGNWEDPRHQCMPEGLPRIGAPAYILHVPEQNMIVFRYNTGFVGRTEARFIPIDGRPHNVALVASESWYGDSVGHWEGDTLVIETIGFTNRSWLHKSGYPHGYDMKVTERITRTGNQLRWEATVDDPEYLYEPWTMDPIVRNLNTNKDQVLGEDLPCYDFEQLDRNISHTRSG